MSLQTLPVGPNTKFACSTMSSSRSKCERCGRRFKRLDTHLRVSATCREVVQRQQGGARRQPTPPPRSFPSFTVASNLNSTETLPGNLNSARRLQSADATPPTAFTVHQRKQPLRLPTTPEEWEDVDVLLSSIVPSVQQAISVEEKNTALCEGIYNIMNSRFGVRPGRQSKNHSRTSVRQHDRALKKATLLKNEACRALREAKRLGRSDSEILALSGKFLSLLRDHSRLKRKSTRRLQDKEASSAREDCRKHFWRYAKDLLDNSTTSQISPGFSADTAHTFFTKVYESGPHEFECPSWMPSPPPPEAGKSMEMTPITEEELSRAIKRSRLSSAPSPLDQISYSIFKKCPSLQPALLDLFNRVVMESVVPQAWKSAAVKLIPKGAAEQDSTSPANFRPIALTPTISKLFSGILRLGHMRANKYLNPDIQKAFLPTVPGVTEHQAKLSSIIQSAKQKKRSLAVAWLDIANAYGSVHHSLIQFSLAHYHAPPEFRRLLQSWYTGLSATISSVKWCTDPVPLNVGVYQGDPLSVVIFLTVMNTLSDTLCSRDDLGYTLPSSSISINHLLYADDACVISNTPAGCQHLLNMVQRWLEWALMKAKVPKCRSLVIQASTGKKIAPGLSIGNQTIPAVEDDTFKFLGMPVRVSRNNKVARSSIKNDLTRMLNTIDTTPLTRQQKLLLFKSGVCPRLTWPLTVEVLPLSWVERELEPLATRYLKKWTGLTRSSNTSILFLPTRSGGLALPSLVSLYRKAQSTRMVQLMTSRDAGVRRVAELHLEEEKRSKRSKFHPGRFVQELLPVVPSQSRRAITRAVKSVLAEEEVDKRHHDLCRLPQQGEMVRLWDESSPASWVKAVQGLPPEPLKFALNATLNTLPTNANLHTWGKKSSDVCNLCKEHRQTLPHVLNNCKVAMDLRRYSERHDKVLEVFRGCIQPLLPTHFTITCDLTTTVYSFPHHITPTNLRPDIVWWSDQQRELYIFELTISYETCMSEARERKRSKYQDLLEAGRAAGYRSKLLTVEVGSRGMLSPSDLEPLSSAIDCPRSAIETLCSSVIRTTLLESFRIWCSRNIRIQQ